MILAPRDLCCRYEGTCMLEVERAFWPPDPDFVMSKHFLSYCPPSLRMNYKIHYPFSWQLGL